MRAESSTAAPTRRLAACTASASPSSTRCRRSSKSRSRAGRRSIARPLSAASRHRALTVVGKAPNRRGTKVRFLPDPRDFRRGRPLRSGARLQDGALEGLSVRRGRDPLALRAVADRGRREDADGGGVPLSRRPQGLSRRRHRGRGRWSPTRPSPDGSRRTASTARSNGRSRGSPGRTASSTPTATPSRPPTAARTRRACAARSCAASRITPSGSARRSARAR